MRLQGIIPALVTPISDDGTKLNKEALKNLTGYILENGADGVCVLGGTGEYCALSDEIKASAIETVVEKINGKIPVIAGIVEAGLGNTLAWVKQSKTLGANAAMVVTPFYGSASQRGMIDYYCRISDNVDIPLVLYNVPYRTGSNMTPKTVVEIATKANIAAVKECSPDMGQVQNLVKLAGDKISVLSGEDRSVVLQMTFGVKGGILASAVLLPSIWADIYKTVQSGDLKSAIEKHQKLLPFFNAVFAESNPGPLKAALNLKGFNVGPTLPPLTKIRDDNLQKLKEELNDLFCL